jgi:hypothetical protein
MIGVFLYPVGMNHDGKSACFFYFCAYPQTGSVLDRIYAAGKIQGFRQFGNFPLITPAVIAKNTVNTVRSSEVYIVGIVGGGMYLFTRKKAEINRGVLISSYRFQGRFIEPVIGDSEKIEARPAIGCGNYRRFLPAVRADTVNMEIPPPGTQTEKIVFCGVYIKLLGCQGRRRPPAGTRGFHFTGLYQKGIAALTAKAVSYAQ